MALVDGKGKHYPRFAFAKVVDDSSRTALSGDMVAVLPLPSIFPKEHWATASLLRLVLTWREDETRLSGW